MSHSLRSRYEAEKEFVRLLVDAFIANAVKFNASQPAVPHYDHTPLTARFDVDGFKDNVEYARHEFDFDWPLVQTHAILTTETGEWIDLYVELYVAVELKKQPPHSYKATATFGYLKEGGLTQEEDEDILRPVFKISFDNIKDGKTGLFIKPGHVDTDVIDPGQDMPSDDFMAIIKQIFQTTLPVPLAESGGDGGFAHTHHTKMLNKQDYWRDPDLDQGPLLLGPDYKKYIPPLFPPQPAPIQRGKSGGDDEDHMDTANLHAKDTVAGKHHDHHAQLPTHNKCNNNL